MNFNTILHLNSGLFSKFTKSLHLLRVTFYTLIIALFSFTHASAQNQFDSSQFINISTKSLEGAVKFSWAINYDNIDDIAEVVIAYQRKIDKGKPWKHTEPLNARLTEYQITNLDKGETYNFKIGLLRSGEKFKRGIDPVDQNVSWTEKVSVDTKRPFGVMGVLILIGSLGLFIFGMKMMSEALQQSAGGKLRQILSSMTANRYLGVLSGFIITALVQSSSTTTVMTVSFVNAGLLTLVESAGVMMGANIGTTITGWLVSIFGFKVSLSDYSLLFIAIGAPLLFINRKRIKSWGNAIIGFALLFMGLGFLKDSVPPIDADSGLVTFFTQFSDIPFLGPLVFVVLGALVTIVVQSSSASMALTQTLVAGGVIPFEVGAAMILGENIGTTITAEIASVVGNVHAKRSARIHSLFNLIGVGWMLLVIPFFLDLVIASTDLMFGIDVLNDNEGATMAMALFHTLFNLTNVLILIWFAPWLVRMSIRSVKSRGDDDEIFKLEYISAGLTDTPELSILEARKEVVKFAQLTMRMQNMAHELINTTDNKKISKLLKKIEKYEEITDNIEHEISEYLSKVSEKDLSDSSSSDLRAMISVINDLERIGDVLFELSKMVEKKVEKRIWFDQKQRDQINELSDKLKDAFQLMIGNLSSNYEEIDIDVARMKSNEIRHLSDKVRKKHLKSMEKGLYKTQGGLVYGNICSAMERVSEHLLNVSEAASGINLE